MKELIDTTDEEIDRFVEDGDPMTLRAALYQLTGDHRLTEAELGDRTVFVGPSRTIVDPEAVGLVRSLAADFLRRHRDAGAPDIGHGPTDRLRESLELSVGQPIPEEALEFCIEELAVERLPRQHALQHRPPEVDRFHVLVIGAGVGGINAAINLKASGIPFTVVDKNDGL